MHGPRSSVSPKIISICAGLVSVVGLMTINGSASAFPAPTITQVQHKLARLNAKAARLGQRYDQVLSQLAQANQRLATLNKQTARYHGAFVSLRSQVGRIAMIAFEEAGATAPVSLLTARSPQQVLNQSSILNELSVADNAQISAYLSASRQLLGAQRTASRQRASIAAIRRSLRKQINVLNKLKARQQALLALLSPAQQVGVGPGGPGSGGGYTGTTATQAGKAAWFASQQIGCPYVFGGTGPCRSGYDCSGLTMSSWQYAGVSIPRVSYDQMSQLPAVPLHTKSGVFTTRYLRVGDILGFAGNSHVGLYIGGGYLVDAPVPGQNVEKIALSGWYLSNLDGAVRP